MNDNARFSEPEGSMPILKITAYNLPSTDRHPIPTTEYLKF